MIDLIAALAVWRLTYFIIFESAPFNAMGRLRDVVGVRFDEWGNVEANNVLAQLLSCPYCASFWVGLVVSWGVSGQPDPLRALAYSAIAIFIHRVLFEAGEA